MTELTAERLREAMHYSPATGVFTRRIRTANCVKVGDVAGSLTGEGYSHISIYWRRYRAHRLAWLYMTGEWPKSDIDHINLDRADNRWCNLREATLSQNKANNGMYKNNKSGFKGVVWHKRDRKWCSSIRINKKLIHLGSFDCPATAHKAYIEASATLFGEFARAR